MLWSIDIIICFTLSVTSTLALLTRSVPLVSDLLSIRELVRCLLGRFRQLDQLVGPNTSSSISTYKHIEGHILAPGRTCDDRLSFLPRM